MSASRAALSLIESAIKKHNVVVFSKTTCPFSVLAKRILSEAGVEEMKVYEIEQRQDAAEIQQSNFLLIWAYIVFCLSSRWKFTARTCAPVIAFFPNLLRMLSAAPQCFVVLLAVQLVQSSSQHNGTDEEHSVGEGFSNNARCSWNCRVTDSYFTKQCDPVFTKKRLIKFNVQYYLEVNKECLNEKSYKTVDYFTDNFNVWTPANITLSSFSRGIQGVVSLTSTVHTVKCYEEGRINGFCHFEPRRTKALRPRDFRKEVKESIEEMGYVVFSKKEVQSSWVSGYVVFVAVLAFVWVFYLPALLCLFSPTLFMENGIRYIVLEGASPVTIRGAVGNLFFFNNCSIIKSTWSQTGEMFMFRLLLVILLILPVALGVVIVNPYFSIFAIPFLTVCEAIYSIRVVFFSLKTCIQVIDTVAALLALIGGWYLLLQAFLGILLCSLLAFVMTLSFPDESLPFVACFLLFCYYVMSSYSSFSNMYHDLSLAIFNCYKKQSHQISHEGLCTNVKTDPSKSKRNMIKIPKELFDMACEELKPIRETLCIFFLKVAFILSFVFLVFYLTMQLHVGLKPVTKTAVAFFTGLFPKVLSKYFVGKRQKRIWALAIEENAPKIVEAYLNRVLQANQGQENSGADTDEVSLRVDEDEEIVEMEVDINTTNIPSDDKYNGGVVKISKELFDIACEELKPVR
ncbi:unnamed protein product [Porites evermanni]|uniref:Glutaredoxin domain-containing protein n=1 Tax=Porites evermanni TaxID=104178 RepID=A0ABN8ND41_9CNID|nr:unnamed protein product [Porites evermanni]